MEQTPTPPAFPVVQLGTRKLVVKFDFLANYRLSVLGVGQSDFRAFRKVDSAEQMDPTALALALKLFSCAVASNFVDVDDPGSPAEIPSPEYWAAIISQEEKPNEKYGEICKATMKAMLKAQPPAAAPAPVEQTAAPTLN